MLPSSLPAPSPVTVPASALALAAAPPAAAASSDDGAERLARLYLERLLTEPEEYAAFLARVLDNPRLYHYLKRHAHTRVGRAALAVQAAVLAETPPQECRERALDQPATRACDGCAVCICPLLAETPKARPCSSPLTPVAGSRLRVVR